MGSISQTYAQFNEVVEDKLSTTDATLTDCILINVPINKSVIVYVEFRAAMTDYTAGLGGTLLATFRRGNSGDITQIGTAQTTFQRNIGLITCNVQANLDNTLYNIKIQVQGKAATNIDWSMKVSYQINV